MSKRSVKDRSIKAINTSPSIHRCSFFPYQPKAINHLAATPLGCLPQVAVLRATEPVSVEIFNVGADWAIERVISGHAGENFECMVFVGPTVLSPEAMDIDSDSDCDREVDISSAIHKNTQTHIASYSPDPSKLNAKHFLPLSESEKFPRARFFTAGVDGCLREWSNSSNDSLCKEIFSIDVNGGAIWSLALSPDQSILAVGCEDGRIRLFSIYDRSVEFLRGFEAVEGLSDASNASPHTSPRILSLAWDSNGSTLVSGSASGYIKLWNCDSGRPLHSIKLANISIWSVAFCDSSTFVSGDSKGQVQFWDTQSGTLLQSFPAFSADVLSLACLSDPNSDRVFATGVDHKIIEFVKVRAPNAVGHLTTKWIQGGKRYFHTHDVRSLTTLNIKYQKDSSLMERTVLISGGVDCTLVISDPKSFNRALERSKSFGSHQRRILPFSRNSPIIKKANEASILAGRIGNTIQIWQLASSTSINKAPIHLADLKLSRYEAITSFDISPQGNFICVLTGSELRLFSLKVQGSIEKFENLPILKMTKNASFPHIVKFLNDSKGILLFNSCEIIQLNFNEDFTSLEQVSESIPLNFSPRRVGLNSRGNILALTTDREVYLVDINKRKDVKQDQAQVYNSNYYLTSVAFLADDSVAVSDCRNAIIRINQNGESIETFDELPNDWKIRKEPIMGIQSHPTVENKISCWTDSSIYQITFPANNNKRKIDSSSQVLENEFKIIDDYRPLLFFAHFSNGDSVVIERPWISIIENFPPAFYRSRYGAQ